MSDAAAIPVPTPDEKTQPWFDAAAEGRLLLQRCDACGTQRFPLWERCDQCWSTAWSWADASGKGTLFSWGRMHRVYHPGFEAEVPYIVAVVELAEGPRIETRLVNVAPDANVKAGVPVVVSFQRLSDEVCVPLFELA